MKWGRAGWLLTDQLVSSLTNFGMAIVVARSVGTSEFGAFSFGFGLYVFFVELNRAGVVEPLLLAYSASDHQVVRAAASRALVLGLVVSAAIGSLLVLVGWQSGGPLRGVLIGLAVSLPGLVAQDTSRLSLIAQKRGRDALLNDCAWAIMLFVGIATLPKEIGSAGYVLLWGASGSVAGVLGMVQLRAKPAMRRPLAWFHEQRRTALPIIGDFLAEGGAVQASLLLIASVSGLDALAAINGARLLLGPVGVAFMFAGNVVTTEGARLLRSARRSRFRQAIAVASVTLSALALTWTGLLAVVPRSLGKSLLGDSFAVASLVVVPVGVFFAARGALLALRIGLRLARASTVSFKLQLISAPLMVVGTFAGASIFGAQGAAWGMSAGALLIPVWVLAFRRRFQPAQ